MSKHHKCSSEPPPIQHKDGDMNPPALTITIRDRPGHFIEQSLLDAVAIWARGNGYEFRAEIIGGDEEDRGVSYGRGE